jgi:uncharacterized membrane protein YkvA (DUF1232 family)
MLRRIRFMYRAQESPAHAAVSTHEEVLLWMRALVPQGRHHRHLCTDCAGAVLLAMPQTRLKRTLSELLVWCGCLGASGLVASPVDLIPAMLPVISWTDDLGYALLALVCGSIGWQQRRRRLTGQASRQAIPPALPHPRVRRSAQCATRAAMAPYGPVEPSVAGPPCAGAGREKGRERQREDACQSPADRVQTFQHTGGQAALTAGESATRPAPATESPREANRRRTHAWASLGGSSLD